MLWRLLSGAAAAILLFSAPSAAHVCGDLEEDNRPNHCLVKKEEIWVHQMSSCEVLEPGKCRYTHCAGSTKVYEFENCCCIESDDCPGATYVAECLGFAPASHRRLVATETDEREASAAAASVLEIRVIRNMTCRDESTIGTIYLEGKEIGRTLELPWRNNEVGISRIPPGHYSARARTDGSRGFRIELEKVKGDRQYVQIHVGNYQRQTEGCILVGRDVVRDPGGNCLVNYSRETVHNLYKAVESAAADTYRRMSRGWVEITVVVEE